MKLRDVARGLSETGEFQMTELPAPPTSSEAVASP